MRSHDHFAEASSALAAASLITHPGPLRTALLVEAQAHAAMASAALAAEKDLTLAGTEEWCEGWQEALDILDVPPPSGGEQ